MVVLLVSHQADFLSKIHGLKIHGGSAGYLCRLSLWVSAYPRAYVARLYIGIQAKKPYDPQKRLKFGLILPYWYKTTKTDYKLK